MPSYVREGSVPHKRHIQFRRPDGGLYAEELFSTKGFESVYSLLYHLHPPTATLDVRPWDRRAITFTANEPLRNRHLKSAALRLQGTDPIESRTPLARQRRRRDFRRGRAPPDGVLLPKRGRRRVDFHTPRRGRYRDAGWRARVPRARLSPHPDRHDVSGQSFCADAHARLRNERRGDDSETIPKRVRTARGARAVLRA